MFNTKITPLALVIASLSAPASANLIISEYVEGGGGGVKLTDTKAYSIGQAFRTKLFLQHEASAIYCYTEVVAVNKIDDEHYQYTLLFKAIRDTDQELVVRASLHAQTRQLKKRQQQQADEQSFEQLKTDEETPTKPEQ